MIPSQWKEEISKSTKLGLCIGDTDAWFSYLFLNRLFGAEVFGYYNLKKMLVHRDFHPSDLTWVDIEIQDSRFHSIGNHMNFVKDSPFFNDKMSGVINPNWERKRFSDQYTSKYPFGVIHLLVAMFGSEFSKAETMLMLDLADGSANNRHKYKHNSNEWLEWLQSDWLNEWSRKKISGAPATKNGNTRIGATGDYKKLDELNTKKKQLFGTIESFHQFIPNADGLDAFKVYPCNFQNFKMVSNDQHELLCQFRTVTSNIVYKDEMNITEITI